MSGMEQDGPTGRDRQDRQDRPGGADSGSGAAEESEDTPFEARLRDLLERETDGLRPGEAPYASIVRQGRTDRRRRLAAAGAGLAALVAVPGAAVAVHFQPDGRGASARPAAGTVRPQSAVPVTPVQLAAGITMRQAHDAADSCLRIDRGHQPQGNAQRDDSGAAGQYRAILAMRATGDNTAPGDAITVVLTERKRSKAHLWICVVTGDGTVAGLNTAGGGVPARGPVAPEIKASSLYQQAVRPGHGWSFPYRWGSIGTVEPQVARVTVSYGGVTEEATLDHGYYAASGILTEPVTSAPRVRGYDAAGTLVYDSRQDTAYEQKVSG
ncbi:hypothetical protein ABZ883_05625 [Streptomyces sp. NPDC046977]|uniref:hypothetical protein n=1 Tax=Streptomyces sp. NPDC046977 TaxID=3154703 RepID=UPI0033FD9AAA